MIFYLEAVLAAVVAGGITCGVMALWHLPAWALVMVLGAVVPLYLLCGLVWLAFIAKIFAFIFRSDRKGNLGQIKEMGIEQWAQKRAASGEK